MRGTLASLCLAGLAALGFGLAVDRLEPAAAHQPFPSHLFVSGWPSVINGPCEVTGADVIVTNGGLSMQGGNVGSAEIGAFGPAPAGQYYVEVTMVSGASADAVGMGICKPAATAANLNSTWTNGAAWKTQGDVDVNGGLVDSGIGSIGAGNTAQLAIDTVNYRIYPGNQVGGRLFSQANPIWPPSYNNSSYGYSFSTFSPTSVFDFSFLFPANKSTKLTVNNGASAFAFVPPMGYEFGWGGT